MAIGVGEVIQDIHVGYMAFVFCSGGGKNGGEGVQSY